MDTLEPGTSDPSRQTPSDVATRYAHITGWGADLDPKDRPGVPMERTPPRLPGLPVAEPPQQSVRVKVFHSTERPGITPIFGSVQPPTGLSGLMRGWAFKLSENDIRHWLLLLAADRVNVVEGVAQDLARGVVPNIFAEMGIKSAWKHDRAGVIRKAVIATAVLGVAIYQIRKQPRRPARTARRLR